MFFPNLLNGLIRATKFYVRERYIDLISFSIYMLSEAIAQVEERKLNEFVKEILA
jgi:hypothetical protein